MKQQPDAWFAYQLDQLRRAEHRMDYHTAEQLRAAELHVAEIHANARQRSPQMSLDAIQSS